MDGQHLDSKRFVRLPSDLVDRCRAFGEMIVRKYASGESEASRSVSYRDADKNVALWTEAKMAECIFAIESGINWRALNWAGEPDHCDLSFRGKRVDVKSTKLSNDYRSLIWSKAKNTLYHQKQFDCLVLTKVNTSGVGCSVGYITKQDFFEKKKIAEVDHRLDEGTWYVEQDQLKSIAEFYRHYAWRGNSDGPHLETFCEICGKPASYGHDVSLLKDQIGVWFCREHNPKEPEPEPHPEHHPNVPNDLQELVALFGGYNKITPDVWEQWDRQQAALRAAMIKRPA